MKRILVTLFALALGIVAFAQYGPTRPGGGGGLGRGYSSRPSRGYGYGYSITGEAEVGFSVNTFSLNRKSDVARSVERPDRIGVFGEYRMDLGGFFDLGIQLNTTLGKGNICWPESILTEETQEGEETKIVPAYKHDAWYWQGAALVVSDFNLLPYSGFNPYIGIGIGPGFGYEKDKNTDKSEWTQALVLEPRVGIELFETLRVGVQYHWFLNDSDKFSNFAFCLSWAIDPGMMGGGGGRRPMRR